MASAALEWDAYGDPEIDDEALHGHPSDLRHDELSVKVLLIEDRPDFARIVCWALDRAPRGHFAVEQTRVVEAAVELLGACPYDAILFDLGGRCGDRAHEAIDAAEALAHRVPVIVLTGTRFDGLDAAGRGEALSDLVAREQVCCDLLPCAILDAIRRHRRVGQGGAAPVIHRMRA